MSNLQILEEINKYRALNHFNFVTKNKMNDDDLYICKVEKENGNDLYVYVSKKGFEELDRRDDSTVFVPMLNDNLEKHVMLCAGPAGAGKGVFVCAMTEQYHKMYPKNKIYYICATPIEDDLSFSQLTDFVKQIDIMIFEGRDEKEILETLEDSLIILDDNDNIPPEQQKVLLSLQNTIMFLGRKYKCSLFKISHYKTDYHNTRGLITEIDYYVTFVNRDIKSDRLLNTYKKLKKSVYDDLKGCIWAFFNLKLDLVITNKKMFFLD